MAFYIPLQYQFTILQQGVVFMAQHPIVPAIWTGDFNMVINPNLGKLIPNAPVATPPPTTRFGRFLSEFILVDTWRHKCPTFVHFSCFTPSHSAMSRIDFIFVSPSILPSLLESGFSVRVLSDHSLYWVTLHLPAPSVVWEVESLLAPYVVWSRQHSKGVGAILLHQLDSVEWSYLWECLCRFGFGSKCIKWL